MPLPFFFCRPDGSVERRHSKGRHNLEANRQPRSRSWIGTIEVNVVFHRWFRERRILSTRIRGRWRSFATAA